MIEILIAADDAPFKFRQVAIFEGRVLGKGKMPFYEACRKLTAEGKNPDEMVSMRWRDSSTVSFAGKLGTFADRSIQESEKFGPRMVKFKPFDADL